MVLVITDSSSEMVGFRGFGCRGWYEQLAEKYQRLVRIGVLGLEFGVQGVIGVAYDLGECRVCGIDMLLASLLHFLW